MNRLLFLILMLFSLMSCVEEIQPIEDELVKPNEDTMPVAEKPVPAPPAPPAPPKIVSKAAVITIVQMVGDNYNLTFLNQEGASIPAGGYKTIINGVDQNDSDKYQGLERSIAGLDKYQKQCFEIDSHYTQLTPNQVLRSNELCIQAQTPPLVVESVTTDRITENSGRVLWTLNRFATGQVEYGLTRSLGSFTTLVDNFDYQTHGQSLNNLEANTVYYYKVLSKDQFGKMVIGDVQSFKTLQPAAPVIVAKAPILKTAKLSGDNYVLTIEVAIGANIPSGGFDTFVNGTDLNDRDKHTGLVRTITNLDKYQKQCFKVEARYILDEGNTFLPSNEVCVEAQTKPVQNLNIMSIAELKKEFDTAWASESQYFKDVAKGGDQGDIYYHFRGIDGNIAVFQVTGETKYLDNAIEIIELLIGAAKPSNQLPLEPYGFKDTYLSWSDGDDGFTGGVGFNGGGQTSLAEGHGWRNVTTLLRIMDKSPNLRKKNNYQQKYDKILAFVKKHIWEKWKSRGLSHFYRGRTHMASHWALMGLNLYLITGDKEYKKVFDHWSTDMGSVGFARSMREMLQDNPQHPGAYMWSSNWIKPNDSQDIAHGNSDVNLIVQAYELGHYWTRADCIGLSKTLDLVLLKDGADSSSVPYYINGSSGRNSRPNFEYGWVMLGRFDVDLQRKLERRDMKQTKASRYWTVNMGHMVMNAAVLTGAPLYYPEQ